MPLLSFRFPFSFVAALFLPSLLLAETGKAKAPSASELDQKAIHSEYNDGDFDKVVKTIESFLASHPTYSRADSVFVAKHLAVVYSANPQTREKGKYYMYRLLEMVPSAELVDMFVSDEVDRIFDKVRKEFVLRQRNFGVDSNQMALPDRPNDNASKTELAASSTSKATPSSAQPSQQTQVSRKGVDPIWWWLAGGAVALGAGITAAVIMSQPEKEAPVYEVNVGP